MRIPYRRVLSFNKRAFKVIQLALIYLHSTLFLAAIARLTDLLLLSNCVENRTVELGVVACPAGAAASATVREMTGMVLCNREHVVVKADKGLAASFSAASLSNPPPDRTSAEFDFICEAFFQRKMKAQRSCCAKDGKPGSAKVDRETYLSLVVVKDLQKSVGNQARHGPLNGKLQCWRNTASWRNCGSKAADKSMFDSLSLSEPWVSASTCFAGTFGRGLLSTCLFLCTRPSRGRNPPLLNSAFQGFR